MFKESFYNYCIPTEDKVLHFNSITCATLLLTKIESNKIQSLLRDPLSFEFEYPSVFEQFVEWGFLFDDSKDEVDIIRYKHRLSIIDSKDYSLSINLVLTQDDVEKALKNDNGEHDISIGAITSDVFEKIKKHIKHMIKEERIVSLKLSWLGSDSLQYLDPVIYPISQYSKDLCLEYNIPFYNRIFSNLSNINKLTPMTQIGLDELQILASSELELNENIDLHKHVSQIDSLLKVIKGLNISIIVNINSEKQDVNTIKECFYNLSNKYNHRFNIVYKNLHNANEYKIDRKLECDANKVFRIGAVNRCDADRKYHIVINHDGKVFSCPSVKYIDSYSLGRLNHEGQIDYIQSNVVSKLAKAPFENERCLTCKHLPICLGPCSQKILVTHKDNLKNICVMDFVKTNPEAFILDFYNKQFK